MKLNDSCPTIETSGDLEEQFFSIQDQGMIFDILRNKMYSDPILAICREISCNARDAHREVGKGDVPIEIHLPTNLEPFFKVKDYGPGISPDRMSNIFIKYTASTKRNDNIQTGGFGLGAKTPFSYSDTFTIITNYNGTQYNYACFIDETKVGKLILLTSSSTSEPNGTEIIIPVKTVDFVKFKESTKHTTLHWNPKPIITGATLTYETTSKLLEGPLWAIDKSSDWNKYIKLIIDEIEYPIDMSALPNWKHYFNITHYIRGDVYFYFNIGELSISANREQVYLDKPTLSKIDDRVKQFFGEITKKVENEITQCTSLWEAYKTFIKLTSPAFSSASFIPATWQGIVLNTIKLDLYPCKVTDFFRDTIKSGKLQGTTKIVKSRSTYTLKTNDDSVIFINDLNTNDISVSNVKKIFDDEKINSVQIMTLPTDINDLNKLKQKIYLDTMNFPKLSEIAPIKKERKNYKRCLVFKYTPLGASNQISLKDILNDKNKKVFCMLSDTKRFMIDNITIDPLSMAYIFSSTKDTSFYGISGSMPNLKINKYFKDGIDLASFIKNEPLFNDKDSFIKLQYAHNFLYEKDSSYDEDHISEIITNKSSLYLKKFKINEWIINQMDKFGLLEVYKKVCKFEWTEADINGMLKKHPEYNLRKIYADVDKKYPLLKYISSYNLTKSDARRYIADYVNLLDKI